jgi:hypothetical protein
MKKQLLRLRNSILFQKLFWPTMRKICSTDQEKICKIFEITRIIYSNSERSVHFFLKQNAFLTCSWRFLRSITLEQFKFNSSMDTTVPNNSYSFWAYLVHKWSFKGYDWHPWILIQNSMPTYHFNIFFMR